MNNKYDKALAAPALYTDRPDSSIKDYFRELLLELWAQGETFSGKKPLGGSDWDAGLIASLVECGYIAGEIKKDETGNFDGYSSANAANAKVKRLIEYIFERG